MALSGSAGNWLSAELTSLQSKGASAHPPRIKSTLPICATSGAASEKKMKNARKSTLPALMARRLLRFFLFVRVFFNIYAFIAGK